MGVQFVSYQIASHSVSVIFHVHLPLIGDQFGESITITLVFGACFMEQLYGLASRCRTIVSRHFNFVPAPPTGNHDSINRSTFDFNQ